jgi:hypothetical protein
MFHRLNPCCYFTLPVLISRGVTYPPRFFLESLTLLAFYTKRVLCTVESGGEISSVEWDVLNEINYFNSVEKMDGVTKFLVYLRVLLCPPTPHFARQETRKKSACGTHNLSIHSIFVCFNCSISFYSYMNEWHMSRTLGVWSSFTVVAVTCLQGRGRGQDSLATERFIGISLRPVENSATSPIIFIYMLILSYHFEVLQGYRMICRWWTPSPMNDAQN